MDESQKISHRKISASDHAIAKYAQAIANDRDWWTVEEAARAITAGYGGRMMLEMSPQRSFGVLSRHSKDVKCPLRQISFIPRLYFSQ